MSYRLFTANRNYSSWSLRPWVLMKMIGIDFTDDFVSFAKPDNHDDFRRFSPSGKVPCLVDEAAGNRIVWDSLAIALYLADRHDGVWPAGAAARAWAQSAVAEMHSGFSALRNDCTMNVGVRVKANPPSPALQRDTDRVGELFGDGLALFGGTYLAGERFSVVDAFFAPVAYRVRTYDLEIGEAGRAWVDRLLALPPLVQWEAEALAEPWREASHEAELAAAGSITADYRAVRDGVAS